ncbi:MAG: hypothetical protein WCA46_28240 [Actinocatenispora sp.]
MHHQDTHLTPSPKQFTEAPDEFFTGWDGVRAGQEGVLSVDDNQGVYRLDGVMHQVIVTDTHDDEHPETTDSGLRGKWWCRVPGKLSSDHCVAVCVGEDGGG